jgi:hypothetical protein
MPDRRRSTQVPANTGRSSISIRDLGLRKGHVVAVIGVGVLGGDGMRQFGQHMRTIAAICCDPQAWR